MLCRDETRTSPVRTGRAIAAHAPSAIRTSIVAKTERKSRLAKDDGAPGALLSLLLAISLLTALSAATAVEPIHPVYLTDADLSEVKRLVEAGADVNSTHIAGGTALHHLVTVSAQMGMDGLMIRDKKIIRPGQWEATGHLELARFLVESGANVDARNADGKTPLHVAALTGHSAAAQFLVEHGAQVDATDTSGKTPLDWARWSATDEAIRELAAATGIRINPRGVKRRAARVMIVLEAHGAR